VPHVVLNAKYHEREAEIVAQAGRKSAVTIATNMAGRGTDILLGGNAEFLAAQKTREIATNDGQLRRSQSDLNNLTQDEERQRRNIDSLRNVAGQQNLVQQYAGQLAAAEVKLAGLRDQESDLQKKKTALEAELNGLIEKAEF